MAAPENIDQLRAYLETVKFVCESLAIEIDRGNPPVALRERDGFESVMLQDGTRLGSIDVEAFEQIMTMLRSLSRVK